MNGRQWQLSNQAAWVSYGLLAGLFFVLQNQPVRASDFPEPLPGYADTQGLREDASLHAVDFASESTGLAVGDRGTVLLTQDGGATWLTKVSGVECRLDDVIWINANRVVAVGGAYDRVTGISRGVVITSRDNGQSWRRANDTELPRLRTVSVRDDGRTIVASGDWSASALSREFESHDFGASWKNSGELDGSVKMPAEPSAIDLVRWTTAAKINVPIRDACRVGDQGLCAVGDHGVITQSRDAGETWQVSRGAKRRSAVIVIANTPATAPWSLIGREALEMRNRVSVLMVQAATQALDPTAASAIDLSRQATMMLGGSGVDLLVETQQPRTDQTTRSSIAAWISIHQPRVIVLDRSIDAAIRNLVNEVAMSAGVQRIVGCSTTPGGESMLHSSALLPTTGVLAGDLWQDALHWVAPGREMPTSLSLRTLYDADTAAQRGESVLSGLPVDDAQRLASKVTAAPRRQLQVVQGRISQPRRIVGLIGKRPAANEFGSGLAAILDQTAKEDQFRLAWSVLLQLESSRGMPVEYSREVLNLIANRFAHQSVGKWAALRIDATDYSMEWQKLRTVLGDSPSGTLSPGIATTGFADSDMKAGQASGITQASQSRAPEIVAVSPFQSGESRVVQASATTPLLVPQPRRMSRKEKPNQSIPIDLAWEFHPLVLLSQAASKSRGDEEGLQVADQGSGNLRRLADDHRAAVWSRLAGNPRVIGTSRGHSQLQQVTALRATSPPRLDGKLNDPIWKSPALAIAGKTNGPQVAYDDEYLYFAWQCPANEIRPDDFDRSRSTTIRDHDLTTRDHIELAIDLDQDLLTSMRFAATDAGRTFDAVDEHLQFNPTWYIAVQREGSRVIFELAIDRHDVLDLPIVSGQSCLISTRCIPANSTPEFVMPSPQDWLRVSFR